MQKFIISVKDKNTGRDVIPPYIVNSLDGLGNYSVHFRPHFHILLFTNSEKVSKVLRCCHDKSWKFGQTEKHGQNNHEPSQATY
jgi:hypothetical protein